MVRLGRYIHARSAGMNFAKLKKHLVLRNSNPRAMARQSLCVAFGETEWFGEAEKNRSRNRRDQSSRCKAQE
jgi:hypothetical protein